MNININKVICDYCNKADRIGILHCVASDVVSYEEFLPVDAAWLLCKAAKVEKMSTGQFHLRVAPLAFRRAYCTYTADRLVSIVKFQLSKSDFERQYKEWLKGRSKYGYNKGNFGEWLVAQYYKDNEHRHHNTNPQGDIILTDGTIIEVKCLVGCSAQIPLSEDFFAQYQLMVK